MEQSEQQARIVRIGVGAVVFRGRDVLLVRRGKPPLRGQWSIPGGGLEYGEGLENAVHREVLEEAGLAIRIGGLIGVFEALPDWQVAADRSFHTILIDYWAEWIAGEPVAGDDATEAALVSLEEALRRIAWEETRRAIVAAANLRDTVKQTP